MGDFGQKWDQFVDIFINYGGSDKVLEGLRNTLIIAVVGLIIGTLIGMIIAAVRVAPKYKLIMRILNGFCSFYVGLFRGTPMVVQLLIMYFIILVSAKSKVVVAVATFSINSGAYVAEIFRGGIMSIDKGQMEAGRSLGLNYVQTMRYTIIPQAMKACLPALANEMIALLKETSICGYIGLNELTRGGDIIRGTTFDALLPLFAVALIYLTFVMVLSYLISLFERRLRKSDNR